MYDLLSLNSFLGQGIVTVLSDLFFFLGRCMLKPSSFTGYSSTLPTKKLSKQIVVCL